MIYGLIPIGGKGTRLSLPFAKEMLPQKNYDHYNPVVNHVVEKMLLAGAQCIVFVHGTEFKQTVVDYFSHSQYKHLKQSTTGFANVIRDFRQHTDVDPQDQVLFGLPDSVFDQNPFVEMLHIKGIVCGLFVTTPQTAVDRLTDTQDQFDVKAKKTNHNQDWFWGILKFDGINIDQMIADDMFEKHVEIGHILNHYPKSLVYGQSYLDLGTWPSYNRYLSVSENFDHREVEKKYNARLVDPRDFVWQFVKSQAKFRELISTDHYFTNNNPNIEFVRFREKAANNSDSTADITVKNFNVSQLNRFELSVPLRADATAKDTVYLLTLLGNQWLFSVVKHCYIFDFEDYSVVMYSFSVHDQTIKIIEVELKNTDFDTLNTVEQQLQAIPGFDCTQTIEVSKFQIIKQILFSADQNLNSIDKVNQHIVK